MIADDTHYLFNNGVTTGYEFANWQNTSSQIVPNPDGSGDNVWSASLPFGTNVEMKKTGYPADMNAYDTAKGRLAFDIRIASLTGTGTDILVKVGNGWPNLSDLYLFSEALGSQPALNTWVSVSIPVQTLLANENALNPGAYADIHNIADMLVFESYNAAHDSNAEIFVRNVRWMKDGSVTPPAETFAFPPVKVFKGTTNYLDIQANHAVHLRAAVCAVWCNRVVRRRGCMRPLHALLHRAERAGGNQTRKNTTGFSRPPFALRCKQIVRQNIYAH